MTTTNKPNAYEQVTDRVIAAMEAGTVPWRKPWRSFAPVSIHGHVYRGINAIVLSLAPYSSPVWMTFSQAKERGGSVKKGEKCWKVLLWKTSKADRSEGRESTDDDETKSRLFCTTFSVFNSEQCEGVALPERLAGVPGAMGEDFDPVPGCAAIVEGYERGPTIEHRGQAACYFPAKDKIHMPAPGTFEGREEYYSTLFHELTHSTGHISRLNRPMKGMRTDAYSEEELVAELGSALLCARAGIATQATIENSAAYLRHWLAKLRDDRKYLVQAASAAQKAVDRIAPSEARASEAAA